MKLRFEDVKYLVIHHSATRTSTTAESIRQYHTHVRGWSDVGYHWLIEGDGAIVDGRGRGTVGAHCPPHNRRSWGICVIGDNTKPGRGWTAAQREAVSRLVDAVRLVAPQIEVVGHFTVGSTRTVCPGMGAGDLKTLLRGET